MKGVTNIHYLRSKINHSVNVNLTLVFTKIIQYVPQYAQFAPQYDHHQEY